MRIKHRYLKWESNLEIFKPVMKILDEKSINYKFEKEQNNIYPFFEYCLEFYLFEDNPEFQKIKEEVGRYLKPLNIETLYEEQDILNAEWFIISTGSFQYPQPEEDDGYLNASYNLDNYCKHCGIGKIQKAPIRLKTEPKQLNNQFWGIHWVFDAIFVRHKTKKILERENIKGIRFTNPVIHKKDTPIQNFYQIHINTRFKNGFNSYNTNKITCRANNEEKCNLDETLDYCQRTKFHHPPKGGYCFDKQIFEHEIDIAETSEFFGSGSCANRLQIVSKRFKAIVEQNNLKGLKFIPIVHEKYII